MKKWPVTTEQLGKQIQDAGCLHNARHYKDCLTVSNWVNETYPDCEPRMTPQAVATMMGWPLKLGMVHPG